MLLRRLLPILLLCAACDGPAQGVGGGEPAALTSRAAEGRTLPELTGRVVDKAGLISADTERGLSLTLQELEQETTDQVVVVTVPDLAGEAIESLGLRLGRGWGIGQKDVNNGVLLIVAPNDRKVRIEVGYGLEGLLTDDRAKAIITDPLLPAFRAGRFEEGISSGVSEIATVLRSDRLRPQLKQAAAGS
jgi:uncharacterized protein